MKRSAPLKRTAFRKKEPPPRAVKTYETFTPKKAKAGSKARAEIRRSLDKAFAKAFPKPEPVRSEKYLRLVAALPCYICRTVGRSQAAHPNTGKGMGSKTDDTRAFPLCAPSIGFPGCHGLLDQGALLNKEARRAFEVEAGMATVATITAAGAWPAELPVPTFQATLETT